MIKADMKLIHELKTHEFLFISLWIVSTTRKSFGSIPYPIVLCSDTEPYYIVFNLFVIYIRKQS